MSTAGRKRPSGRTQRLTLVPSSLAAAPTPVAEAPDARPTSASFTTSALRDEAATQVLAALDAAEALAERERAALRKVDAAAVANCALQKEPLLRRLSDTLNAARALGADEADWEPRLRQLGEAFTRNHGLLGHALRVVRAAAGTLADGDDAAAAPTYTRRGALATRGGSR